MLSNRYLHLIRLFAIILLSYFTVSCGDGDGPAPVYDTGLQPEQAYTLVWSDEFDVDGAPDVRNWRIEYGFGVNNEWQTYTDDAENVRVENGNLVITAQCSNGVTDPALCNTADKDGTITSARINTNDKVEVKYGNIQARIKMPPGKGTWPAFWMLGADFPEKPWPRAGEIDIVEVHQFYSDIFTTHFTVHWCDDSIPGPVPCEFIPGRQFYGQNKKLDMALSDDYHVYEVDWDESRIVGKIDGVAYFTKPIDPDTEEEFLNRFFMILNVAVGGDLGGPPNDSTTWPQEMLVDWVRVYEKNKPDVVELVPDQRTAPLSFVRFVNSAEFGGDSVVATIQRTVSKDDEDFADITPPAVTPLTGNTIVEFDYESANTFFSGGAYLFKRKDLSDYTKVAFSLDVTAFSDFDDISIEMQDERFTGDGTPGKASLLLSNYTPITTVGNWNSYEIPLSDFIGVKLENVVLWGFWNPVNTADQRIAGTLYVDDMRFVALSCNSEPSVTFDSDLYKPTTSAASVTVSDICAKSSQAVVKVETDTGAIGVGVALDAAGNGDTVFNLAKPDSVCSTNDAAAIVKLSDASNPLIATYSRTDIDADGSQQIITVTDIAGIDPSAPDSTLVGDELYFYATDPAQELRFVPDVNFAYSIFGSDSVLNGAFSDTTFNPVFAVTSGTGYGGGIHVAQVALIGGDAYPAFTGFAEGAEKINFKIKDLPVDNVIDVEFGVLGGINQVRPIDVTTSPYSTSIGDGWYEVSIPMTEFPDVSVYNYMAYTAGIGTTDGFTFLITDIYLQDSVGNLPAECDNVIIDPVVGETIGVYSETNTDPILTYDRIINASEFSGNQTVPDESSTVVTPFDGVVSLEADFQDSGASYGGIIFEFQGGANIDDFITLKFAINATQMPSFADIVIQPEDGSAPVESVYLSNYSPTSINGDWSVYEIPLSAFPNLDKANLTLLGFWNASQTVAATTPLAFGQLYFDDIHFSKLAPSAPAKIGLYSETTTNPVVTYDRIINASEFSGNQTIPDENSTVVTPFDGVVSLEADFQDSGASYGGIIFEFQGGRDIDQYLRLKFAINTTLMPSFADIVIQPEDGSAPVESVFLSNYAPTSISGDWSVYEIPLSAFPNLDKANLTLLGFWNASQAAGATTPLAFGQLYFDDIVFEK
jgi:beta-glucanase (GH16 family)